MLYQKKMNHFKFKLYHCMLYAISKENEPHQTISLNVICTVHTLFISNHPLQTISMFVMYKMGGRGGSIGRASTGDSKTRELNPVRSTRKHVDVSESKCCADSSVCPTTAYARILEWSRTHVINPVVHVRLRWITNTRKHFTQENTHQKTWVAPYYGSLSPGKAARISHALHWDKTVL